MFLRILKKLFLVLFALSLFGVPVSAGVITEVDDPVLFSYLQTVIVQKGVEIDPDFLVKIDEKLSKLSEIGYNPSGIIYNRLEDPYKVAFDRILESSSFYEISDEIDFSLAIAMNKNMLFDNKPIEAIHTGYKIQGFTYASNSHLQNIFKKEYYKCLGNEGDWKESTLDALDRVTEEITVQRSLYIRDNNRLVLVCGILLVILLLNLPRFLQIS